MREPAAACPDEFIRGPQVVGQRLSNLGGVRVQRVENPVVVAAQARDGQVLFLPLLIHYFNTVAFLWKAAAGISTLVDFDARGNCLKLRPSGRSSVRRAERSSPLGRRPFSVTMDRTGSAPPSDGGAASAPPATASSCGARNCSVSVSASSASTATAKSTAFCASCLPRGVDSAPRKERRACPALRSR